MAHHATLVLWIAAEHRDISQAPVAQLDRATASEAVGQTFESSRAHHFHLFGSKRLLVIERLSFSAFKIPFSGVQKYPDGKFVVEVSCCCVALTADAAI